MRSKIFVFAFVVLAFLNTSPAHAVERDFLVGTWESNTTMNGYMERAILTLRANGTGRQVLYAL